MASDYSGSEGGEPSGKLQRIVEAAAITPKDARELVQKYRRRYRLSATSADNKKLAKLLVNRYARLSATSGVVTALPSVVPGIGTVAAALGGGLADLAASLKFQVDLCYCLVEVFDEDLPDQDKSALGLLLALAGSAEQIATTAGKAAVEEAARRVILMYLRGSVLQTVKALFRKIGITFLQKTAAKVVPFGIGVGLSGAANYALTQVVGAIAIKFFEERPASDGGADSVQ